MDPITEKILSCFEEINRIPRCSGHEQALAGWIRRWAQARQLETRQDQAGNLVVRIPPSPGFETAPGLVLQAHLDMVCEKTPFSHHDFSRDPIRMKVDGDWLTAQDTSLGADNGVAVAMGLVLAEDPGIAHPSLELLLTVEEETGLTGASRLDENLIRGKILLNLDSEDEGVFTVGCAGGKDSTLHLPVQRSALPPDGILLRLSVSGLRGGHSGVDIDKCRANANRLLCRALMRMKNACPIRLISMEGGTARNAIPRDAEALLCIDPKAVPAVAAAAAAAERIFQAESAGVESGVSVAVAPEDKAPPFPGALTVESTETVLRLILALPTGVVGMSPKAAHSVETSANLAKIRLAENDLVVQTSQRSSVMSRLEEITWQIESAAGVAGARFTTNEGYPAWQPDMNALLLRRCKKTYESLFAVEPKVEVIHAGLECAIIGAKFPEMEMISFGPTMKYPHSPEERLYLPSLERVWRFVLALLASYRPEASEQE